MGTIANTIEMLKSKVSYLQRLADECDTVTASNNMYSEVFLAFELLKPLSNSYQTIRQIEHFKYRHTTVLAVGTWIKIKHRYQKYGSEVTDNAEFFTVVRAYGDEIAAYVRSSIKDEFTKLVELTKQLRPYDDLKHTINVSKQVACICSYDVTKRDVLNINKITLDTSRPLHVTISPTRNDDTDISIDNIDSMPVLEDIIDDVISLYKRAKEDVSEVKEYNEPILAEIKRIYAPRKLSKELGSG